MRLALLFASLLISCHPVLPLDAPAECKTLPTAKEPLRLAHEMGFPARVGETFFTLTGGHLSRPVLVPLFFQFEDDDLDDKCSLHNEAFFFELDDGRVYIGQYNSWCGGRTCRI